MSYSMKYIFWLSKYQKGGIELLLEKRDSFFIKNTLRSNTKMSYSQIYSKFILKKKGVTNRWTYAFPPVFSWKCFLNVINEVKNF